MPKFLFNISNDDYEALRQKMQDTGAPMSYHVRQGLKLIFADKVPCSAIVSGQVVSGWMYLSK
jgi:hypothetical protein